MSLPTGSGKLLCYFILPRVYDILKGITLTKSQSVAVVVRPLIALMKDHVHQMVERDMSAIFVTNYIPSWNEILATLTRGNFLVAYLPAPSASRKLRMDHETTDCGGSPGYRCVSGGHRPSI